MAQLYLPATHTDADRALARRVAAATDSAALFVVWTPQTGNAAPAVADPIREPAPERTPALVLLAGAVVELWARLRRPQPAPVTERDLGPGRPQARPAAGEAPA